MSDLRSKFPRKSRIDEIGNEVLDVHTIALGTIDGFHKRIHAGKGFEYDIFSNDIDTSKGCRIAFWVTGTALDQHILPIGGWSAGSRLEIWEQATLGSTGAKATIYNCDRTSSISGSQINLNVFSGISISNKGTRIRVWYDGSSGGGTKNAPGGDSRNRELIIKPNIYYLAYLQPDANDTKGSISLQWYEEEE